MADQILEIGATIDLSQIVPGLNTVASATEVSTQRMTTAFERAAAQSQRHMTLDQEANIALREEMSRTGSTLAEVMMRQGRYIEDVQERYRDFGMTGKAASSEINAAFGIIEGQSRKANIAIMGLGQDIGVAMPRSLRAMLSGLGPVSGIMAAAFAPVAVIALIEYLGRIPALIGKATDQIMGFGEAQKKAFQEAVSASDQALTHFHNLEMGQHLMAQSTAELGRMATETYSDKLVASFMKAKEEHGKLYNYLLNGVQALHAFTSANAEFDNSETKITDHLREQNMQYQKLELARQKEVVQAVQVDKLKSAEIGATAAAKEADQIRILNLEEEGEVRTLRARGYISQQEITDTHALFDAKREMARRTAELEIGGQSIAVQKAKIEAAHEIADAQFNITKSEIQREASEKRISDGEELAALKRLSAEKLAVDQKYYADRQALARKEAGITGKPAGPEVIQLGAKATTEGLTQAAEIARAVDAQIIAGAKEVDDAIRAAFMETGKETHFAATQAMTGLMNYGGVAIQQARTEEQQRGLETMIRMDEERYSSQEAIATRILRLDQTSDAARLKTHQITLGQWIANERAAVEQWYAVEKSALQAEAADAKEVYGELSPEYQRVMTRIEEIDIGHQQKLAAIDERAQMQFQKILNFFDTAFETAFSRMTREHMKFSQGLQIIWQQLEAGFARMVAKMIADSIKMELTKRLLSQATSTVHTAQETKDVAVHTASTQEQTAATAFSQAEQTALSVAGGAARIAAGAAEDIASIVRAAGVAAAHAFKWVIEEVPFPYNIALAAGVAAAVYGAVRAFAKAEKGMLVGEEQLVHAHPGEAVLPAHLTTGLQNVISAGAFSTPSGLSHSFSSGGVGHAAANAPTGSNVRHVYQRNEFHLHHNGEDAKQVMERDLVPAIQRAMRRGEIATP